MSYPTARVPSSGNIYTRAFWLVFVANLFLCTANTMTFRFAEFVTFLGGSEEMTGRIVAAGLVASMIWRAFLGQAIDRFGVRNVWLFSTAFYLIGVGMLVVTSTVGWQVYVARATFVIGLASMFACALSFVQSLAPPHRRTEIIATYGASGFLGMIAGAQLGDLLFHIYPNGQILYRILFTLTMVLGGVHGFLAIFLSGGSTHVRPDVTPAVHQLFMRYFSRPMLVVTIMMGLIVAITTVFLTRFATERGIGGLRTFFTAYAVMAFIMRLAARNWSRQAGRHRLIVYGLLAHVVALLALLPVREDWHFIPAALCIGFGQALLFPCVISLSTGTFPEQYRGTGTTITLSMIDLGSIVTAPILGGVIDHAGFYPMFAGSSVVVAVCSGLYAFNCWKLADIEGHSEKERVLETHRTSERLIPVPATGTSSLREADPAGAQQPLVAAAAGKPAIAILPSSQREGTIPLSSLQNTLRPGGVPVSKSIPVRPEVVANVQAG